MIPAALAALSQVFSVPYRGALFRTLGITLLLLALAWAGLDRLIAPWIATQSPWATTILSVLTGVGLFIGLAFLVAPISALVAGLHLDELAERAELASKPAWPPGRALSGARSIWLAARFALVALFVNALALALLLVPGVNAIAFLAANSYLMGREYFELAAMRYRPPEEARAMRRAHAGYLFLAGLPIALMLATPILNLLTPLFGVAYMVRIHKRLSRGVPA
jgi:CysZ protein